MPNQSLLPHTTSALLLPTGCRSKFTPSELKKIPPPIYKYVTERDAGAPVLPNVFSGFNGLTTSAARSALSAARIATGMFNPAN
ncbi:hypothetical protein LINPERHAP2_LOCUS783 [Linum perenne]